MLLTLMPLLMLLLMLSFSILITLIIDCYEIRDSDIFRMPRRRRARRLTFH
jgi:hypothetical protein